MVNEESVRAILEDRKKDREYVTKRLDDYLSSHLIILPSDLEQINSEALRMGERRSEEHQKKYPREDIEEALRRETLRSILELDSENYAPIIQ
jgi:hypothetical protein